jgi:hypothetical protein
VIIGIAAVIILPLVGNFLFGVTEKFCNAIILLAVLFSAGYFLFYRQVKGGGK